VVARAIARHTGHMMNNGLEGVVAATTRLSHVDGERGELVIAGFQVEELAERATFEETTWLLWHGDLPSAQQLSEFREMLGANAALSSSIVEVLRAYAHRGLDVMDALSAGLLTLALDAEDGAGIVARVPTIIAAYWRLCADKSRSRRDLTSATQETSCPCFMGACRIRKRPEASRHTSIPWSTTD